MISKINTESAASTLIVEVTPDDLMVVARRMHLEADKAMPGEEILVPITERITLKYNPEVTTAGFSARSHTKQPTSGSILSTVVDNHISSQVLLDEAREEELSTNH